MGAFLLQHGPVPVPHPGRRGARPGATPTTAGRLALARREPGIPDLPRDRAHREDRPAHLHRDRPCAGHPGPLHKPHLAPLHVQPDHHVTRGDRLRQARPPPRDRARRPARRATSPEATRAAADVGRPGGGPRRCRRRHREAAPDTRPQPWLRRCRRDVRSQFLGRVRTCLPGPRRDGRDDAARHGQWCRSRRLQRRRLPRCRAARPGRTAHQAVPERSGRGQRPAFQRRHECGRLGCGDLQRPGRPVPRPYRLGPARSRYRRGLHARRSGRPFPDLSQQRRRHLHRRHRRFRLRSDRLHRGRHDVRRLRRQWPSQHLAELLDPGAGRRSRPHEDPRGVSRPQPPVRKPRRLSLQGRHRVPRHQRVPRRQLYGGVCRLHGRRVAGHLPGERSPHRPVLSKHGWRSVPRRHHGRRPDPRGQQHGRGHDRRLRWSPRLVCDEHHGSGRHVRDQPGKHVHDEQPGRRRNPSLHGRSRVTRHRRHGVGLGHAVCRHERRRRARHLRRPGHARIRGQRKRPP